MTSRYDLKLNQSNESYSNFKATTGLSYKETSINGLYKSAKTTVQETTDEVERSTTSTSTKSAKTAQTIAMSLAALTALAPVATTIIGSKGTKVAAGTNVDANLKAFQEDGSKSNRKTLEKDLVALRSQRDQLESSIEAKNNQIAELDSKMKSESTDGKIKADTQQQIADIDRELSGADKAQGYGKTLADIEAKKGEISGVDTNIKTIEDKNKETVKNRETAQAEKDTASKESAKFATEISNGESKLPGLKSTLSTAEGNLKAAKKTDKEGKVDSAKVSEWQNKVNNAKTELENKEKEIAKAKENKKAQDKIVKTKTKEIDGYNKSMTDDKTNVKELLTKKEQLTAEEKALQDSASSQNETLVNKKAELQKILDKGVVNDLAEQKQALEAEIKDIKDNQLKALDEKIATVEKSLDVKSSKSTAKTNADVKTENKSSAPPADNVKKEDENDMSAEYLDGENKKLSKAVDKGNDKTGNPAATNKNGTVDAKVDDAGNNDKKTDPLAEFNARAKAATDAQTERIKNANAQTKAGRLATWQDGQKVDVSIDGNNYVSTLSTSNDGKTKAYEINGKYYPLDDKGFPDMAKELKKEDFIKK